MATSGSPGAIHGGAFFEAIGTDFRSMQRAGEVIPADVLDAWFPPAPGCLEAVRANLPFLLRTSPPIYADGLIREIAKQRDIPAEALLAGAGSSDLMYHRRAGAGSR
jgi:hypothetical protein